MIAQMNGKIKNAGPEKLSQSDDVVSLKAAQSQPLSLPFVTLWQDEAGVIQIKLGNNITPVNAIALLELGNLRYKVMLLPSVSPRPAQAPEGSIP